MDAESRTKWKRLGELLAERRARIDVRYANRRVFGEEVGVSAGILRDIEIGARTNYTRPTLAAVEKAYQWAPGSIEEVLAGGDPIEIQPPQEPEPRQSPAPDGAAVPSRWFLAELRRSGIALPDITAILGALREIAGYHEQTLAELLVESGLASPDEMVIRKVPDHAKEAIAGFRREVEEITASSRLSRRQRRAVEDRAVEKIREIRKESREDV